LAPPIGWQGVGQVVATGRLLSGRYRIDEPLGAGGMARVWRGQDLRLRRPVAIKELAGPWLADPTASRRFDREAWIAARLAHPNIVSVYDVGGHDSGRYLVMELVDGETVAQLMTAGPMPIDQVVAITLQTCDGLAAAHAAGVVHRDIKPANLMVTRAGVVKICDFGIAKAPLEIADTSLTGPMYAMGTSRFMAPEQPDGRIDARTDLYALGCTIYAMLTGDAPFDGRDAAEILQKHRDLSPAPLREHRADVGAELEALVSQLLAKPPDARPASAADVKGRLEAMRDGARTIATQRQASAPITVRLAARSPVPSAPRPAVRRVSAHAAVPSIDDRYVRRIVVRGLAVAGTLVVVATVAVMLAAASRSASVEPEGLDAGLVPTSGTPAVVAPASLTRTRDVTPTPDPSGTAPSTSIPPSQPPSSDAIVPVSSSHSPPDPIANLRLSIQQQVSTGHLNPDKATDLYKKVDEIARAINNGDAVDARRKVQDFRNKITTLLNEGQLTVAGRDVLARDLDAIPLP
jgi:eukaryotic-like serine/threonine-protein kinase